MGELTIAGALGPQLTPAQAALAAALQSSTSLETQRAYRGDLTRFFASRGLPLSEDSVLTLCGMEERDLAIVLSEFKLGLLKRGLSPASINRPLATVRTLLRMMRRFGLTKIDPTGLVDNERPQRLRDVRGPSDGEIVLIMDGPDQTTLTGLRDYAILRLLWENALRRAEVAGLSIGDYDPQRELLGVRRKGSGMSQQTVEISPRAVKAVNAYLEARLGMAFEEVARTARHLFAEPLFENHTHNRRGRLTGGGVYGIVRKYGLQALGRPISPHKIRHSSGTTHQKMTGDLRATQKLLGHKSSRTTEDYLDDQGAEVQGKATKLLSQVA